MSGLSTPQITYKRSLIPRAAKQYLSHIHWKVKATKCMKWILNVSQDSETFFMRTSFIHLTKLPTVHSCTFNVDNETESDDVRDELEIHTVPTIPITTTESPENLPSVGEPYKDTCMQQVRSLGPSRQRKAPNRFHPEE